MGLLDNLEPPKKVHPCRVRELAQAMSKEDAKIFLEAVKDANWPIVTLAEALRARGVEISATPLTKHRKGSCSC